MRKHRRSWLPMLIAFVPGNGAVAQGVGLAQRIDTLEQQVQRVESLRAIKRLQYAYGHYVEFGLWHDFADLFAEDAVAHYPAGDLGREAIRELFLEQVGQGQLGLADGRLYPHFVLQPVVTLDPGGRTARGRWHLFTMLGGYGGNASWVGGVYENDYVLENGVWKISELRTSTQFSGSYAGGWTDPPPRAQVPSGMCENYLVNDCTIPFHYDAGRAGAPLGTEPAAAAPLGTEPAAATPFGSVTSAAAPQDIEPPDLADLTARTEAIDGRIERLLDETEVRNLQHAYGYYVDRRLWDDVADLFTADATFELGLQGVYRGQTSIRRMLEQFGPQGIGRDELDDHLQLETIVTVAPDGRTARARGIDFALTGRGQEAGYRAEWREAVFENGYVEENGVWKISAVHLYPRLATDYALGWAEDARPAPSASEALPPDEPPTVVHGVYPAFYIPPFHFANPVTGAPPQYPAGMAPDGSRAAVLAADPPEPPSGLPAAEGAASAAALAARLDGIERRLDVALGQDAVENLANAFNFALDELDREQVRELFVPDGVIRVSNAEVAGDRTPIRAPLDVVFAGDSERRPAGFFAIHQTLQPVIHVAADGRSARIRYRLFEPAGRIGEEGAWIAGIYESDAVADSGVWKLDRASLYLTWAAEYSVGWAGAAPLAEIAAVPFHYDNPVTGRARPAASTR